MIPERHVDGQAEDRRRKRKQHMRRLRALLEELLQANESASYQLFRCVDDLAISSEWLFQRDSPAERELYSQLCMAMGEHRNAVLVADRLLKLLDSPERALEALAQVDALLVEKKPFESLDQPPLEALLLLVEAEIGYQGPRSRFPDLAELRDELRERLDRESLGRLEETAIEVPKPAVLVPAHHDRTTGLRRHFVLDSYQSALALTSELIELAEDLGQQPAFHLFDRQVVVFLPDGIGASSEKAQAFVARLEELRARSTGILAAPAG